MKKALIVFLLVLSHLGFVHAAEENTPAKKQAVTSFIDASDIMSMMRKFLPQMLHDMVEKSAEEGTPFMKNSKAEIEKMLVEILMKHFDGPNGLVERTAAIYSKYYTKDELEALTTFLNSPVGRKSQALSTRVSLDLFQLGRAYTSEILPEMQAKLLVLMKEKGIAPKNSKPTTTLSLRPGYPDDSSALGEEGVVTLRMLVKRDGGVDQVALKSSSGFKRLDQAALGVAKSWKFMPAVENGQQAEAWTDLSFVFKGKEVSVKSASDELIGN